MIREFNFDGLIGPTHNYAGLSYGNVASDSHRHQIAHPKAAALQGLTKMKTLADLGIGQAVLPPLRRPDLTFLQKLGFDPQQPLLEQAFASDPVLLATCYSASSMWTANAATVSPSADTADGKLHLTVANLASTLHRSIEHPTTLANLEQIFANSNYFVVSPALPSQPGLADEGAANHTRLARQGYESEGQGIELFVFGVDPLQRESAAPKKFPARQTKLASQAIARRHKLRFEDCFFIQQHPDAIDAGVFHNDVISVGHQNVLLCHELSFLDQANVLQQVRERFQQQCDQPLFIVEFSQSELSLSDAVQSYLFNSQLVTRPDGGMTLVCPSECERVAAAKRCTERLLREDNPVDQVLFLDLRQSMNNGGGPACLRLRVAMTAQEQAAVLPSVMMNDQLFESLIAWVERHYRDELSPTDLGDPKLAQEVEVALAELAVILGLSHCY